MTARALGVSLVALATFAAPASAGVLGPEDPVSPNAGDISTIYWVMFVVASLIALAINVALVAVVVRFRSRRDSTPARTRSGRGLQRRIAVGLAVPMLAIFVLGIVFSEQARDVAEPGPEGLQAALARTAQVNPEPPAEGGPLVINAFGQQWLWRFEYPGGVPGARTFSYEELTVPVDTPVILNLTSTDVVHRWWVPSLGGKVDAVPGQTASTWFRADEEGTYEGHSAQFSGTGYPTMRATVEVVSASEYEQFVSEQERDLAQAQDAVQSEIERAAATQTAEQREATPPQNKGESGEAGAPSGGPGQSGGEAGGGE